MKYVDRDGTSKFADGWEKDLVERMRMNGDVFVDIGAHVGAWCLNLANSFQIVYAFEPDPRAYDQLCENIKLNEIHNIIVEKMAISNVNGRIPFNVFDLAHSTFRPDIHSKLHQDVKPESVIDVDAMTLDSFFSIFDKKIDLIKVDVEGAEIDVLQGAVGVIKEHNPNFCIEYHSERNRHYIMRMFSHRPLKLIRQATNQGHLIRDG
jgi:FkbM family methyltransferase